MNWIDPFPLDKSKRIIQEVSSLLAKTGGPLTQDLSRLIDQNMLLDLVNFKFDYMRCSSLRDITLARQVHALLSKQEWMDLGIDTRSVAEKKFWQAEERCKETNATIDACRLDADAVLVIERARRIIKRLLGNVPPLSELKFRFGPGATTSVNGRVASPRAKLFASLSCSREFLPFVGGFLAEVPLWVCSQVGFKDLSQLSAEEIRLYPEIEIHAGKLSFVPKDARSMRPIVVEPTLNGFFQLGVGQHLKDLMLRRANLDLTDQKRNQSLACEGSIHGGYATVDLSSASDTVSISIVRLLLPDEWFEFLMNLTTGELNTPNGVRSLEKFSSMGNGFTFELESLIFYALSLAVSQKLDLPGDVSAYGDDIIINSRGYPLLASVLSQCGFVVNDEKSYWSGPFRESCGADWFEGNSIRPYYAKKAWSERTLYTFHNWAIRNSEPDLASLLYSFTEPSLRLFGPDGYGDGHLIGSFSLRRNRKIKRSGWEGGFFDTYSLKPRRLKRRYASDWVYPSYSVYTRSGERSPTDPEIVRGSSGYAKVSIYSRAMTVFGRAP